MTDFENIFSFFFGSDGDKVCLYCKSSEGDLVTSQPAAEAARG